MSDAKIEWLKAEAHVAAAATEFMRLRGALAAATEAGGRVDAALVRRTMDALGELVDAAEELRQFKVRIAEAPAETAVRAHLN